MTKLFRGILGKVNGSYWLRSGFFTLSTKLSTMLFGVVNFIILVRILSKDDFGAWVLFTTVASFMEMIKHGFVRNPLIRYLSSAEGVDYSKIQTASFYLNVIIGLLEVLLLLLCAAFLGDFFSAPQLSSLFVIYIFTTIALIPTNHFDVIPQARMQFNGTFFSHFTRQFGLFIFILIAFFKNFPLKNKVGDGEIISLDSLAIVQCISVVAAGFVSFLFAKKWLTFSLRLDMKWFKELFHYGKFTFGTNVSSSILKNVDKWMLGKLISPSAVAIFDPAIRLSNLVEVPTDTLTSILFPQLSKRIGENGVSSARYLYEKAVGTITSIMLPVVLVVIVFAEPIVYFMAGPGFAETIPILQVTMLYGLIIPFNRLMGITLDAIGKARANFLYVMRNALINIVSNYFYISYFGIIGAAYGTLTTYLFALIHNQIYLHRHLNVRVAGILFHVMDSYRNAFAVGLKVLGKKISKA